MTKNRITTISLALLLSGAGLAMADDAVKITFAGGASEQSIAIDAIQKVTFDGDNLVVLTADGASYSLGIDDIASITFTADLATALTPVTVSPTPDVSITYGAGLVRVSNPQQEPLAVAVFTAQGQLLRQVRSASDVEIDFTALPSGIYIVKANSAVLKIKK